MKEKHNIMWHIERIKNDEIRLKCLENLDERFVHLECYSVGYALMLAVNQPAWEKEFWTKAYWELRTEADDYVDNSSFYKLQPVQQGK